MLIKNCMPLMRLFFTLLVITLECLQLTSSRSVYNSDNSIQKIYYNIEHEITACPIYCHGPLLHTVQMAHLFKDSKTFVDMKLKYSPELTLNKFAAFMKSKNDEPTQDEIREFVNEHFEEPGKEFVPWQPDDWKEQPAFISKINDPDLRQWAADLNAIWKDLGRKMIDDVHKNPEYYSIIPVEHPVIVPGGRFIEFYYWDSYWIIRGLLISEMTQTAKGMLENFLSIVQRFGFIPNGGRIYYAKRSQPPMLTAMVKSYVEFTNDIQFALDALDTLEHEFEYWMNNHTVQAKGYNLYVYNGSSPGPRPESYREDIETAQAFATEEEKEAHYGELKAAAESGLDFTSRWFINSTGGVEGNLTNLKTHYVVPVELNSILYWNAKIIAEFHDIAGNKAKADQYAQKAADILEAIEAVLWNEDVGAWLDYDLLNDKPRNFFVPTNLAPLWTKAYNNHNSKKLSSSILKYIESLKLDSYPGGVPNTLYRTGEQWDFPNVWPPMQYMLIEGLENLGTAQAKYLSNKWAQRWVKSNFKAYSETRVMFEKYNAEHFGGYGGGGEYEIQKGFGWTNGVIIEFLNKYGREMSLSTKALQKRDHIDDITPTCKIYCYGPLLHTVQLANIFKDSKTFVDMKLKNLPDVTLAKFETFMTAKNNTPTQQEVREFVEENFDETGKEFQEWTPDDWIEHPAFIDNINDPDLKQWGVDLNLIWKDLGRKMIDDVHANPEYYSIISVPNPVIVPGGRFIEFYYWDSYWIIRGLLYSQMTHTAKGMIQNFLSIVERFGFIPNGGRVYYARRSQPPLLTAMIKSYVDFTNDIDFAIGALNTLENEYNYWTTNHSINVKGHNMFAYGGYSDGPRPESYREDWETSQGFSDEKDKQEHFLELKAGAESGMDFSSRWFINSTGGYEGNLSHLKTRYIVPVELNAIIYWNCKMLAEFYGKANNTVKSEEYAQKASKLLEAIEDVLWNDEIGSWLDYDTINEKSRDLFVPTNLAPLWTGAFDAAKTEQISKAVLSYVDRLKLDSYPGGVPNSLYRSGEQWDFPNVWPPMQYLLVEGLDNLGTAESKSLSAKWGQRWVKSNFAAYKETQAMYEKYDAEKFGGHGGGGEYEVQKGFGWSNGVIIEFLNKYGKELTLSTGGGATAPTGFSTIKFVAITLVTLVIGRYLW